MERLKTVAAAIASDAAQPETAFGALNAMAERVVGVKLFTLSVFDRKAQQARRLYSNMPDAYPVSGLKPVVEDEWTQHVLDQHHTFVANDIDGIAEVFPDFELIKSLGCQSVMNIPIAVNGNVLGTINCLHDADFYTEARVAQADILKLPGAACFMLNALLEGDR